MIKPFDYFAYDQTWTDEILKELRDKYNVIYRKGVFGVRIIKNEEYNPPVVQFEILGEDDGHLFSQESLDIHRFGVQLVDIGWIKDLQNCLDDAVNYVKNHPEKFGVLSRLERETTNYDRLITLSKEQMSVFMAMDADPNEYYHMTKGYLEWMNKPSKDLLDSITDEYEFKKLVKELEDLENAKS